MNVIISAEVWFLKNTYYLRAYSLTTAGVGYAINNPIHIVKSDQTMNLGTEILETLKECKMGVPHPDFSQKQPKDEMIKATLA